MSPPCKKNFPRSALLSSNNNNQNVDPMEPLRLSHQRGKTENHLIPHTCHTNKRFKKRYTQEQMAATIEVCRDCHRAIHHLVPYEKQLGRHYNTHDKLLTHPQFAKISGLVQESEGKLENKEAKTGVCVLGLKSLSLTHAPAIGSTDILGPNLAPAILDSASACDTPGASQCRCRPFGWRGPGPRCRDVSARYAG